VLLEGGATVVVVAGGVLAGELGVVVGVALGVVLVLAGGVVVAGEELAGGVVVGHGASTTPGSVVGALGGAASKDGTVTCVHAPLSSVTCVVPPATRQPVSTSTVDRTSTTSAATRRGHVTMLRSVSAARTGGARGV
jgi:hypothetical protein